MHRMYGSRHNRFHAAFTIVEVLVVSGVCAILLAIAMPLLSKSRGLAQQIKCSIHLRSHMQSTASYGLSFSDGWPYALERDRGLSRALTVDGIPHTELPEILPGGVEFVFLIGSLWHAPMHTSTFGGNFLHPSLICPSNAAMIEHAALGQQRPVTLSYTLSNAMLFTPDAFDPKLQDPISALIDRRHWRGQRIADVAFPALKAAYIEAVPFHEIDQSSGVLWAQPPWRLNVASVDGSVAARQTGTGGFVRMPSTDPTWRQDEHTMAFQMTPHGIRGRDW